jgi:hypothetical protein
MAIISKSSKLHLLHRSLRTSCSLVVETSLIHASIHLVIYSFVSIIMTRVYLSITGLQIKNFSAYPQFFYHAFPSLRQAVRAPGNISATATSYKGIQFTMTVWESREYMLQYLHTGAHLQAMKAGSKVGSYVKVFGDWWDTDQNDIPNWNQARRLWEKFGRVIIGKPCRALGDAVADSVVAAADAERERADKEQGWRMTLFYFVTDVAMIPVVLIIVLLLFAVVVASLFGLSPLFVTYQLICNLM